MSQYGVTYQGFARPRLPELQEQFEEEMRAAFGQDLVLSPDSPDGQDVGIRAEGAALLWELAETVYNSFNPEVVTGAAQDRLYSINGITRKPGTPSSVTITLRGQAGTLIPAGSLVASSVVDTNLGEPAVFSLVADTSIPTSGEVDALFEAQIAGEIGADPETLTEISTTVSGWTEAINFETAVLGTPRETDEAFRIRRRRSIGISAVNVIDSIHAAIADVDGVSYVFVHENLGPDVDDKGLPPHSIRPVVIGGDDQEIADAIYAKIPVGIISTGSTTLTALTKFGYEREIGFVRPTTIDIYVQIELITNVRFPASGHGDIISAVIDYVSGAFPYGGEKGFGVGELVCRSRFFTPINSVSGHTVTSLKIGRNPLSLASSDIDLNYDEVASVSPDNISVLIQ